MKLRKKLISWVVIVALVITMMPGEAFAAGNEGELGGTLETEEQVVDPAYQIASIDSIEPQVFNGYAARPEIVVRNGNGDEVYSFYYDVTYENIYELGVGKVKVTGRYGYEGSVEKEFYIIEGNQLPQAKIIDEKSDLGKIKLSVEPVNLGNLPVTYEVSYGLVNKKESLMKVNDISQGVMFNDLQYNGKYQFKVRAIIGSGQSELEPLVGPWSEAVFVYANRFGDRVQKVVRSYVTKIDLGKTSARVHVKEVKLSEPSLNVKYSIGYRIKDYDKDFKFVDINGTSKRIYHLDRGVKYEFCVKYYYASKIDGKRVEGWQSKVKVARLAFPVENILKIARSWIGISERKYQHRQIVDLYNSHEPLAVGYKVKYTDEWCATTVSAMFIKAGATSLPGGTECGVQRYIELFKKRGIWEENGRITPKPGYLICYNWDDGTQPNNGWADHIGIVEKVSKGKITVIEGNHRPKGHKYDKVARRTIRVGYGYIRGYAKVPYYRTSKVYF